MKSIFSALSPLTARVSALSLSLSTTLLGTETEDCTCIELDRVVVTARPSERPLTVVTDPRAPAQPIPAQDGAEVLRGIAGLSIIRKGGTDGDPVLRGMAGSRVGILLDGEAILGGCGNRMDPPTAYVFPAAYDRVTVLKGPQSVTHGAGNSAGVVLFERTPPRYTTPTTKISSAATFGSFGRNDQFFDVSTGMPHLYAEFGANRTQANDYEDGEGREIPSAYKRWSSRAALGWTPDNVTWVELSTLWSDGQAAYADRAMDGSQFTRRNLSLRARRDFSDGGLERLEATLFVNEVDHVMDNYSLRPFVPSMMMPGRAASNPDRLTYGARVLAKMTPGTESAWAFSSGLDYQFNRHRVRSTANQLTDPYGAKARIKDAELSVAGLFSEATWALSESRRWVSGLRFDSWKAQDHRSTVATGMMGATINPTAGNVRRTLLPSAFVRYEQDLKKGFSVFVGLGHTQRFPDYWELVSKESLATASAFNTSAERTTQLDTGITWRSRTLQASLSVFSSEVQDYILIQTAVSKPSGMMGSRTTTITRNIDATSIGGEASLAWHVSETWTLDAALSTVRAENRTDRLPLAQQPPVEGRIGLSYATRTWSVGSLARMASRQNRYAINQGNIAGQDLGPSSGFATFSLNAAWKPAARWQISAGVDNLLDRSYAEHLSRGGAQVAGFPAPSLRVNEPGRTLWTKIDFRW